MVEFPSLKTIVDKYQLLAKKSLGQNFLLDQNITDKIIRLTLQAQHKKDFSGEILYEIGPGPGGLTRSILRANPQRLTVIEMDTRCIQIMQEIQNVVGKQLQIIEGDALQYNFTATTSKAHIISNLPYNISVPLLINWLQNIQHFASLTLMFQKEVAERITAEPGSKNYGRISVLAQLNCTIKSLMNLSPTCFVPAPKIWSSVLLFIPHEDAPDTQTLHKVEKITGLAFGQRRKMIRQSLKAVPDLQEICANLNIPLTSRAENLSPQQYMQIAKAITNL